MSDYAAVHFDALDRDVLKTLEADQKRTVTFPSATDAKVIKGAYDEIIAEYAGASDHNRELLARVRAALAKSHPSE